MIVSAVVAVVLGLAAFTLMSFKDRTYASSEPYAPTGDPNREVAVVYYSRSGHTEAAAREIARIFNAPIARIGAEYSLDYEGQSKAIADTRAGALPKIEVQPLDLAPAKRVFLLSPTWMFRPATPLWAYVEQADLSGKQIVLVMTGNSRYKQEEIDAFAKRVEIRGGRLTHHVFLQRGRIYWQQSREELLSDVRPEIAKIN